MLFHGSLLLAVMVSLGSSFPNPFGSPKLPSAPALPNPSLPKIDAVIPSVTGGGILDKLTALLRFLGILSSPITDLKNSLPLPGALTGVLPEALPGALTGVLPRGLPGVNGILANKPGLPPFNGPDVPAVGGSSSSLEDLNRRISKLEAVLKLEGRIQMVGEKIIATSGKEVDFATSNSTCNGVGGRIVTPMNEAENNAALVFVKKHNRYAYLGMREGPIPGIFNYMNGAPASYTRWRKGEPSGKGAEGCVEMYTDGQWNDKACNQNRLTVCEL